MDQNSPLPPPPHSYINAPSQPNKRHPLMIVALTLFVGVPAFFFWGGVLLLLLIVSAFAGGDSEEEVTCTVARVPLHGIVTTTGGLTDLLGFGSVVSADDFVESVRIADEDESIEAILIDIDSPGGTPVAADEMMNALLKAQKPVVAVVRELGASAAYWIASGADHIVASPVSNVGSIGVTMSYLETASSTETEGSRWIDLSSGAFKDAGHPERVLRKEEEDFYKGEVQVVHDYMVDRIATAREALSHEEVAALADGRAYVGTKALELKLVDALGSYAEALSWIAERTGSTVDDVTLCEVPGYSWNELF